MTTLQICRFLGYLNPSSFQKLRVWKALFSYIFLLPHGITELIFICIGSKHDSSTSKINRHSCIHPVVISVTHVWRGVGDTNQSEDRQWQEKGIPLCTSHLFSTKERISVQVATVLSPVPANCPETERIMMQGPASTRKHSRCFPLSMSL